MTKVASPKQINFIAALIEERKVGNNVPDVAMAVDALRNSRITSKGASSLIDTLLAQPKDVVAPPVAATAADAERTARAAVAADVRRNGYGSKCAKCGVYVPAQAGVLTKEGGRWVTRHFEGDCPRDLQTQLNEMLEGWSDGFFAIPFIGQGSHTDLTFFGIRTRNNDTADRYVVHTVGGHADTEDVSIEWVGKALAALATVDRRAAMEAYGLKMGYCGACGRHLTNETSRKLGLGPDCASK